MIEEVFISTDYIKLNQFLKLTKLISNGSEDKQFIFSHLIFLNEVKITERGKKLHPGDIAKIMVTFDEERIFVIKKCS